MRVNRNRLDLRSLIVGVPCTITTGVASAKLVHGRESIDMGLYLNGVDPLTTSDQVSSSEDEHGQGIFTKWLHLDALAPRRLYIVTVTRVEKSGQVAGWWLKDATPRSLEEPKLERPKIRETIGRLFGKTGKSA